MTDFEYQQNLAFLDDLVSHVRRIKENAMASLHSGYRPNFVLIDPPLPSPLLIPHPHENAPVQWRWFIAGSVGAAVTIISAGLSVALMLSLVHT